MREKRGAALLGMALVVSGCAMTRVTASEKRPELASTAPVHTLAVAAVASDEVSRLKLEQELAEKLSAKGVQPVPSSQLLPTGMPTTHANLVRAARRQGVEAVLISEYEGVDQRISTAPRFGYDDYLGAYGSGFYSSAYGSTPQVRMETSLIDVRGSGKVVWQVTTETPKTKSISKQMGSVAKTVIQRLEKDGLLTAR